MCKCSDDNKILEMCYYIATVLRLLKKRLNDKIAFYVHKSLLFAGFTKYIQYDVIS